MRLDTQSLDWLQPTQLQNLMDPMQIATAIVLGVLLTFLRAVLLQTAAFSGFHLMFVQFSPEQPYTSLTWEHPIRVFLTALFYITLTKIVVILVNLIEYAIAPRKQRSAVDATNYRPPSRP